MMKIVEIINSLSLRGGAEVFLYSLVKELSKDKNVEILVISLFGNINDSFKNLSNDNVMLVTCDKRKGMDFKASKKIKKIINEFKPDVVHTHLSCSPTLFFAFGLRKRSWRYIHTVHNMANNESSGIRALINKLLVRKNIMELVGISKTVTKSIEEKYKTKNVYTIYNGVQLMDDYRFHFSKRTYDFICVARFYEQKNHLFLLDAFKTFLKTKPDSKLLLVGDGILKEACENYCLVNNLNDNVVFKGQVTNVEKFLNDSRVMVLTSLFEGNPISVLEGMSVGLPIISSSVGGVPDVVCNNENGYLFNCNDKDKLLSCMHNSLDEKSWLAIRKNNLLKCKDYSIENCSKEYKKLFMKGLKNENN